MNALQLSPLMCRLATGLALSQIGRGGTRLTYARRACLAAALYASGVCATQFPEGIDYTLQAQSYPQYQSNPFRGADDSAAERKRSDQVIVNAVRAAARVPLLSELTRLELSGTLGDARYSHYTQLNHQPKRFDAALLWRAGKLFSGRVDYAYDNRLYNYLNRTFPERDMVETKTVRAEVGMNVTDRLQLPVLSVNQGAVRYDYALNRTVYNRNDTGAQAAFRYLGRGNSYISGGIRQSNAHYLDRTPFWTDLIDNRYRDHEVFLGGQWDYSVKTTFGARIGYLDRDYKRLSERNEKLVTLDALAGYDYSVKTRFDLNLWRRPYANDDNPTTLYSTVTGARASVRYKLSEKTRLSFNVVGERQQNTPIAGGQRSTENLYRSGVRVEWAARDNVLVVLDGYRDQTKGANGGSSYNQNVARIGVVISFDNGPSAARLLWNPECEPPKYVEASVCDNR